MARSTAAAGIARPCHIGNRNQSVFLNLPLDSALRDKKTGADQRFISRPIVTRSVTVFANRREQRIACEPGTVFVVCDNPDERRRLLCERRSIGRRLSFYAFSQQRRRRNQNMTSSGTKPRLRHAMHFVNLYRDPGVPAAYQ